MESSQFHVVDSPDRTLSEEEKELIESIGAENIDYCAAAILSSRYPDLDVQYIEEENAFEIGGDKMELDFDLIGEAAEILVEDSDQEANKHAWISEVVITIEMLFELV